MERPEATVTIYDVARAAGVSASTVSRTFSRPGRVSSATAQRIRAAAAELGYRTHVVAAPSRPAQSQLIGLAVSDVTNPFYFGIIRGAEQAAAAQGYAVVLLDARESGRTEREVLRRCLPLMDGLVVASSRLSDTDLRMIVKQVPVMVLNRAVPGLPSVVPDNPRGTRRAVEHLAALGHTTIHYLAGPDASWANGMRWRALTEATLDLSITTHRLGPFPPTVAGGRSAAAALPQRLPTAVIAYNDLVAIGLMNTLRDKGIDVPADISIVGYDNTVSSELVTPGLTTVEAPLVQLGQEAAQNVLALARGATWHHSDALVVPMRLVERGSTAAPRTR